MDLIANILALVNRAGMSQNEFGKQIGVTGQVVSDWKSGRNKSYERYLPKIAECLGVSIDDLVRDAKPTTEKINDGLNDEFSEKIRRLTPDQKRLIEAHIDLMLKP